MTFRNWVTLAQTDRVEKFGGSLKMTPIFKSYINRLVADADTGNFNVIWDCGNGASGPATIAATNEISGKHTVLFGDVDGHFPNHHPNRLILKRWPYCANLLPKQKPI